MASASYWQELIELWECSGLTQSEFCHQHNLGQSTFSKRISLHPTFRPPVIQNSYIKAHNVFRVS